MNSDKIEKTCFIASVIGARLETGKRSAKMALLVDGSWEKASWIVNQKGEVQEWVCPPPSLLKWFAPKYKMSIKDKGIVLLGQLGTE